MISPTQCLKYPAQAFHIFPGGSLLCVEIVDYHCCPHLPPVKLVIEIQVHGVCLVSGQHKCEQLRWIKARSTECRLRVPSNPNLSSQQRLICCVMCGRHFMQTGIQCDTLQWCCLRVLHTQKIEDENTFLSIDKSSRPRVTSSASSKIKLSWRNGAITTNIHVNNLLTLNYSTSFTKINNI